jgi:hypothetical protein
MPVAHVVAVARALLFVRFAAQRTPSSLSDLGARREGSRNRFAAAGQS